MNPPVQAPVRNILVVEDEPDIAQLLLIHLSELGEVRHCADGAQGLEMALGQDWDALVLDLRLPSLGGLDICRALRQAGRMMPILMLTARNTELDRVLGLEMGADDYLTKPFGVLELQARLRALWRRSAQLAGKPNAATTEEAHQAISLGSLALNRRQRRAWMGNKELVLTPREFDLLWFFARQPGRAFSRSELLASVWGYSHDGYDHTVNTHINRLRNKLGLGDWITTVWGVGYRFDPIA